MFSYLLKVLLKPGEKEDRNKVGQSAESLVGKGLHKKRVLENTLTSFCCYQIRISWQTMKNNRSAYKIIEKTEFCKSLKAVERHASLIYTLNIISYRVYT